MLAEKGTSAVPPPSGVPPLPGIRLPKVSSQAPGLIPLQRNQPKVVSPPGLAVPFKVAPVEVRPAGGKVVTTGAAVVVKKLFTNPVPVPGELWAMAQK